MEITRPDDLSDIADLGLTLVEAKLLLAGLQQEIVAAQVRDHAARRPDCPRCGGVCRVKDYRSHASSDAFWPGHDTTSSISLCRVWRDRGLASTGHRIADRHLSWTSFRRISPP